MVIGLAGDEVVWGEHGGNKKIDMVTYCAYMWP
jgi:hypothetical protein